MILPEFDWHTRFAPTNEHSQKAKFEPAIEGLRGLAALWVFYAHAISPSYGLDQGYQPIPIFGGAFDAVLIFFILSGYVIGLTNTNNFSKNNAQLYLLRRGTRLLPMYFLAIAMSYFVSPVDSLKTVVGNIFFLQNLAVPIISGNGPLWSLNYEVIYYLVFLIIWRFRPKVIPIIIGTITIIFFGSIFHDFPKILVGYFTGWLFWLFGLCLAWRSPSLNRQVSAPLISIILVLLATSELHLGPTLFTILKLNNPDAGAIISLPACALLFAIVANRPLESKVSRLVNTCAFLMPFGAVCYGIFWKGGLRSDNWILAAIELFLAVALIWVKVNPLILKHFAFLGNISYGVYIFHAPCIFFIRNYFPNSISGTIWSFLLRLSLLTVFTMSLACFMEVKVQPKIKAWFQRNSSLGSARI
jgi:peptidoglycan/LPS O-acetylase OafA/YrhL